MPIQTRQKETAISEAVLPLLLMVIPWSNELHVKARTFLKLAQKLVLRVDRRAWGRRLTLWCTERADQRDIRRMWQTVRDVDDRLELHMRAGGVIGVVAVLERRCELKVGPGSQIAFARKAHDPVSIEEGAQVASK